jgi:OmcA/MtrC family decaheme c-type cytochrome
LAAPRVSPYKNATLDNVPNGSAAPTRLIVTKAACQNCHAPDQAIAHGSRYDPKYCVVCHNPTNPVSDNATTGAKAGQYNLGPFVHRIHTAQLIDNSVSSTTGLLSRDFREVKYPQDVKNCDTCHNDTQGTNWKNLPSIEACGSCHSAAPRNVNFTTGDNHVGGPQGNNSLCGLCHTPTLITGYHADPNTTPNNVTVGADNIVYFIDNVTMSGNFPVVTFHITRNGTPLTLASPVVPPNDSVGVAYTSSPAFLLAFAMPQDTVTTPADYTNFGNAAVVATGKNGQPESVSLTGLTLTGTSAAYTTTLTKAFPAGATMRAVALQSYWSQTVGGVSEGRHTPSVVKAVTGDAVRRQIIHFSDGNGCSACHKRFEGHGGSRVQNVQVCVICHNPNNTSSGRTIDPAIVGGINPEITALFGSDPLQYPEVPNNFKDLIHGIHSSFFRANNVLGEGIEFVDVRNRQSGVLLLGNEITFPGNLKFCTKCHIGTSYNPASIPANVLLSTTRQTTGVASETRAQIIAARNQPNATDLVNSPIAAACYGCHATVPFASHMVQMGGDINSSRAGALMEIPWELTLTP